MTALIQKIKEFFVRTYTELVNMDDTPHRIAFGFGVGVFLGILPGTGPLAALGAAFLFKMNKPAVLLGCLLTNAWLSLVTFILSLKIGSAILGLNWKDVSEQVHQLFDNFTWGALMAQSAAILKPLLIGFAIVGALCGLVAYAAALFAVNQFRKRT